MSKRFIAVEVISIFVVELTALVLVSYSYIWAGMFAVLGAVTPGIVRFGKEQKKSYDRRKARKERYTASLDVVSSYFEGFLNIDLQDYKDRSAKQLPDVELSPLKLGYYLLDREAATIRRNQIALKILFVVHLYRKSSSTERVRYLRELEMLAKSIDMSKPGEERKDVLELHSIMCADKSVADGISDVDFDAELRRFTSEYLPAENHIIQLQLDAKQAEEYNRTLSELFLTGKINTRLLSSDVDEKLSEISKKTGTSSALLWADNKAQHIEGIKKLFARYPFIRFGRKFLTEDSSEPLQVHMRLIYPGSDYTSAEVFMKDEVVPVLDAAKETNPEAFVAIIPIQASGMYTYPERRNQIDNQKFRSNFDKLSTIQTGEEIDVDELTRLLLNDSMTLDNILSVLPFNVFIPQIDDSVREYIISNYDTIRDYAGVSSLTDWADKTKQDILNAILSPDESTALSVLEKEEWEELVDTLHSNLADNKEALLSVSRE